MAESVFVSRTKLTEYDTLRFSAEASELGWKPGFFPEQFDTDVGNQQPMMLTSLNANRAQYAQIAGCISLTVYND